MRFTSHLLLSFALLALYPLFGSSIFIVMLASVLIDIDHLWLLFSEDAFTLNKIRLLNANIYLSYKENPDHSFKGALYLFHTVEFIVLLAALSFWQPVLLLIASGFSFHVVSDVIHHVMEGLPVRRWLFITEFLRINKVLS